MSEITIPVQVARAMMLGYHPLRAWRDYFQIDVAELSKVLEISECQLLEIENSNQHLHQELLTKLARLFGLHQAALAVRYISHY